MPSPPFHNSWILPCLEYIIRCVYSTGTGTPKNGACSTGTGIGALFGAWMAWIPAGEMEME